MQYSVALKCDDHEEWKNGYLPKPQFPDLQNGGSVSKRFLGRIKEDDVIKASSANQPDCRLYPLCCIFCIILNNNNM